MKKLFSILFSFQLMAILLLIMAGAAGVATLVENDFGQEGSRAVVYHTWWYEWTMILLGVNLLGSMIIHKVYQVKKLSIFLFHISFIFILIGGGITRYISFEGMMHIREGAASSTILSSEYYVYGNVIKDGQSHSFDKSCLISPAKKSNRFSFSVSDGSTDYDIHLEEVLFNAEKNIVSDPTGSAMLNVVALGENGRSDLILHEGDESVQSGEEISFGEALSGKSFSVFARNDTVFFLSKHEVVFQTMVGNFQDTFPANMEHQLKQGGLYSIGNTQLVFKDYFPHAIMKWEPASKPQSSSNTVLKLIAENGDEQKEFYLAKSASSNPEPVEVMFGSTTLQFKYGPQVIDLPFSLYLQDFQLERYPGSNSPSSYASDVVVYDKEDQVEMPFRIFMNHILNYRGYRFFQSSYDQDELGTILSVNHDYWGTWFSYFGYLLMSIAMILSVFNRNSRFMKLARSINLEGGKGASKGMKAVSIAALLFLSSNILNAQGAGNMKPDYFSPEIVKEFSTVLVQDHNGRIKPFQSMASEVSRKVARSEKIEGQNAVQVVLGMYFFPEYWQEVPMIKVSSEPVQQVLGLKGNIASFYDFFDIGKNNNYKLNDYVQKAYQKKPSIRNKFDNDVIKIDERLNVAYLVYSGSLMRLFPSPTDDNQKWYAPEDAQGHFSGEDQLFVTKVLDVFKASLTGDKTLGTPIEIIQGIKNYQQSIHPELIPPASKIKIEILLNKTDVFNKLSMVYGLIGFVLLVALFLKILFVRMKIGGLTKVFSWLIIIGFVLHTVGLAFRWYVSGHAPWSNGYESMIYIAWATMLAGIVFARKSAFVLPAVAILSSLTLFVAHLSWMNPEITNLVPVLKSYWLTIHVSIITASYGFLGMGMVLGLLNLVLYLLRNKGNKSRLSAQIDVLSKINEMTLIVGTYMLWIGTFLGGVWANESWGRYWGWDPKETWALITGLIYVVVIHMRFIPGFKSRFSFNTATVVAFFSVMMTYFGVNYYLSGMHSYAQGDPVPVPTFVYYTVAALIALIISAYFKYKKFKTE